MNAEQLEPLMDAVAEAHGQNGQTYGKDRAPYRVHLDDVTRLLAQACRETGHTTCDDQVVLMAAGILHDWFEDCFDSTEKLAHYRLILALVRWQEQFGVPAVSLMMALRCTDPAGFVRVQAKAISLPVVAACEGARCVKLADRIVNLRTSTQERSRKHLQRYVVDESAAFAVVADEGPTPVDAVQETRHFSTVRAWLAQEYAVVLSQGMTVLRELHLSDQVQ